MGITEVKKFSVMGSLCTYQEKHCGYVSPFVLVPHSKKKCSRERGNVTEIINVLGYHFHHRLLNMGVFHKVTTLILFFSCTFPIWTSGRLAADLEQWPVASYLLPFLHLPTPPRVEGKWGGRSLNISLALPYISVVKIGQRCLVLDCSVEQIEISYLTYWWIFLKEYTLHQETPSLRSSAATRMCLGLQKSCC